MFDLFYYFYYYIGKFIEVIFKIIVFVDFGLIYNFGINLFVFGGEKE